MCTKIIYLYLATDAFKTRDYCNRDCSMILNNITLVDVWGSVGLRALCYSFPLLLIFDSFPFHSSHFRAKVYLCCPWWIDSKTPELNLSCLSVSSRVISSLPLSFCRILSATPAEARTLLLVPVKERKKKRERGSVRIIMHNISSLCIFGIIFLRCGLTC